MYVEDNDARVAESPFLTGTEAAEFLRLSPRTLEAMRLRGGGPAYRKFGRRVLYSRADLAAYADAHRRVSTSDIGGEAA